MRFFIYISYDGTGYHGWQIQPNGNSIQETIQKAFSTILRRDINITGAGRTDAGVHARMMVAHVDYTPLSHDDNPSKEEITANVNEWCSQLTYRLNRILPQDISIQNIERVADDMHARFSATSRTYHYYIHTQKSPFERHYSLLTHYRLDFEKMNEASAYLLKVDDFASFCKTGADNKTTICKVTEAQWIPSSPTNWYFKITADRFLRNMVRAVVGTLLEVGRGRITLEEFYDIVNSRKRTAACESLPGHALFLENITYF